MKFQMFIFAIASILIIITAVLVFGGEKSSTAQKINQKIPENREITPLSPEDNSTNAAENTTIGDSKS